MRSSWECIRGHMDTSGRSPDAQWQRSLGRGLTHVDLAPEEPRATEAPQAEDGEWRWLLLAKLSDSSEVEVSVDDGLDEVDSAMMESPEINQRITAMEDAYRREAAGEPVDWDDMIDRYGVG